MAKKTGVGAYTDKPYWYVEYIHVYVNHRTIKKVTVLVPWGESTTLASQMVGFLLIIILKGMHLVITLHVELSCESTLVG